MEQAADSAETPGTFKILCVDDEPNILSSLRRALRPAGYTVFVANSGAEGLATLEKEVVDLVISDMRMPEMDGAKFLAKVAERWPTVTRVLLTGYSDIGSTIAAINDGGIYRYLSKPWDDNDLRITIQRALETRALEKEKRRLQELSEKQNEELKHLNANLEKMVEARTSEVNQTAAMLEITYEELKQGYRDAVQVFANLIELREGATSGHGRRVAELARSIGEMLELDGESVQNIYFGGLLHDIGKIGIPDDVLRTPYRQLEGAARQQMQKHTVMGQAALIALHPLQDAAKIVRSHHERFDGKGYPDGLRGSNIPLGARVLMVANEYDALQNGSMLGERMQKAEAKAFIEQHKGSRYDPNVVDAFLKVLASDAQSSRRVAELKLGTHDLEPGMLLSRDLFAKDGLLLLAHGHRLSDELIDRLARLEQDEGWTLVVYVRTQKLTPKAATA